MIVVADCCNEERTDEGSVNVHLNSWSMQPTHLPGFCWSSRPNDTSESTESYDRRDVHFTVSKWSEYSRYMTWWWRTFPLSTGIASPLYSFSLMGTPCFIVVRHERKSCNTALRCWKSQEGPDAVPGWQCTVLRTAINVSLIINHPLFGLWCWRPRTREGSLHPC